MTKLEDHFVRMQEMSTRYLMHLEPYIDREGNSSKVALGSDQAVRDRLFTQDMIYMLDGPEQRDAQAPVEDNSSDLAVAIGEHAFKAGYDEGGNNQQVKDRWGAEFVNAREKAWSEYDPPEDLKGGGPL